MSVGGGGAHIPGHGGGAPLPGGGDGAHIPGHGRGAPLPGGGWSLLSSFEGRKEGRKPGVGGFAWNNCCFLLSVSASRLLLRLVLENVLVTTFVYLFEADV